MSLTKRRKLFAARTLAAVATVVLPGRARVLSWTLHEVLRIGPSILRNNDWYGPVAKSFRTDGREVWLTIDDGPHPEQTPRVLDKLAAHSAKASFFAIGNRVDWNRSLCRRIVSEGHTLENHTYSHPSALFWSLPSCAMREEIVRCNHSIHVAAGVSPGWFRSPVGMTNACVHPAAARSWLRVAGWSAAGLDGRPGAHPQDVIARIMRQLEPGGIIVLHEGPGRRVVETVDLLLERLDERGFRCIVPEARNVIS